MYRDPETNSWPLKIDPWKRRFLLETTLLKSFQGVFVFFGVKGLFSEAMLLVSGRVYVLFVQSSTHTKPKSKGGITIRVMGKLETATLSLA